MISAPAIHFHRPRVSVSVGACRVCDLELGLNPALVQIANKGSEWVCASCMEQISKALSEMLGKRRVRQWLGDGRESGEPILPVEGEARS